MFFFFRCTAQLTNQAARSRAPLEELIWNQVFNLAWKCKGKASLRKKRLLQKLIKCGEPAPLLSFLGALDKSWIRLYLNCCLVFSKNYDFPIKTCRLIFYWPSPKNFSKLALHKVMLTAPPEFSKCGNHIYLLLKSSCYADWERGEKRGQSQDSNSLRT